MNIRKLRQEAILKLIAERPIYTQDDLIKALGENGFDATQATISRDIKELELVKRIGKDGKSSYATAPTSSQNMTSKFFAIFSETVISADYALNTCVIKTHVGMANAACAALDADSHDEVLGTLAGDDTIFALCRTEEAAKQLCEKLNKIIGE